MLPYQFYLNLHLFGIFLTLTSLSALATMTIVGRDKISPQLIRLTSIGHGLALVLVLVGGFGMLARLGLHSDWPGWLIAKLVIWIIFGGAIALIKRRVVLARVAWVVLPALGLLAAYFAIYKPF